MQIPGGIFLDRFGTRLTYALSVCSWSFFTLLHGTVGSVTWLLACRCGLGIAEAPCFPANSRVVATWFPQQERAFATSIYTVGEYVGLALLSSLFFSSRRRHTRFDCDWSSDVCSSDLLRSRRGRRQNGAGDHHQQRERMRAHRLLIVAA